MSSAGITVDLPENDPADDTLDNTLAELDVAVTDVIDSSMRPIRPLPQHLLAAVATESSPSKQRAKMTKDKIVFSAATSRGQSTSAGYAGGRRRSSFSSLDIGSLTGRARLVAAAEANKAAARQHDGGGMGNIYMRSSALYVQMRDLGESSPASPASPVRRMSLTGSFAGPRPPLAPSVQSPHHGRRRTRYATIDLAAEVDRYLVPPQQDGACNCSYAQITKDAGRTDYSAARFHAHALFHACSICARRPASFLCLHCMKALCPSHVTAHHNADDGSRIHCTLFLNAHDLLTSFDRIFWCEPCKRFTWKYTEEYEPLADHIAATKGTFLDEAVNDVWMSQYFIALGDGETERGPASARGRTPTTPFAEKPAEEAKPEEPPKLADDADFLVERWERARHKRAGTASALRALGCSVQGWRSGQEDAEAVFTVALRCAEGELDSSCAVYCVFDGHGGDAVAKRAANCIQGFITKAFEEAPVLRRETVGDEGAEVLGASSREASLIAQHYNDVFTKAVLRLDAMLQESEEGHRGDYNCVGATACIVAVTEDFIICANLGDSGAALFHPADVKRRRTPVATPASATLAPPQSPLSEPMSPNPIPTAATIAIVPLSSQHRLSESSEADRVRAAGYSVVDGRIEGMLAVPRALGDFDFKQCGAKSAEEQAVSPLADVVVVPRKRIGGRGEALEELEEERAWCIIVGCDGVWDTAPTDEVCKLAHLHLFGGQSRSAPHSLHDSPHSAPSQSLPSPRPGSFRLNLGSPLAGSNASSSAGVPSELNAAMVGAANAIIDRCVAQRINDDGSGTDNVSLILIRPCPPLASPNGSLARAA